MLILFLPCAGKYHFWVSVPYFQKRSNFTLEGVGVINAVCYLDIELFASLDRNKINFLFVQHSRIKLIASAQQFNCYDIFNHSAIIRIFCSKFRVFKGMITEIIFIIGGKITLSLNIVPSDLIERKCVTKVFDIGADRPVIRLYLSECKCIYNASGRGEV